MLPKKSLICLLLTIIAATSGCGKTDMAPKGIPAAPGGNWNVDMGGNPSTDTPKPLSAGNLPTANKGMPLEKYAELKSGAEVAVLYYAISGLPVDYEKLAQIFSREFRETTDGFKKQEILQALKPKLDANIAAMKLSRYYVVENEIWLNHFDFNGKTFPVTGVPGKDESIYFFDSTEYQIGFTNGEEFKAYRVEDVQKAKQIEAIVAKGQAHGRAKLYLFAQDIDSNARQVKFQTVRVVLNGKDGLAVDF